MKFKIKLITSLTTCILLTDVYLCNATGMGMGGQGSNPCGGPFNDPCPVPLDSGTGVLLITGLLYGGKKVYDSFKK